MCVCVQVEYIERGGVDWTSQRCTTTDTEVKELQPDMLYSFRVRETHTTERLQLIQTLKQNQGGERCISHLHRVPVTLEGLSPTSFYTQRLRSALQLLVLLLYSLCMYVHPSTHSCESNISRTL